MSAAAIPYQLYNWLPPEIIWGRVGTVRSDIYSFCTVVQEAFTDTVPWSSLDGLMVKEMLLSGRSLSLDPRVPTPLHSIVQIGTCLRQRDRTLNLQDIRFTLRNQLQ
ncbi:inactive serine/threonine-protein kinase TEX14-like, partial [Cetorhinus maximus]